MIHRILILLAALTATTAISAETPVRTERVALFKNGLGYFTSSVQLPADAATVTLRGLPVPAHGTFWVEYDNSVPFHRLISRIEKIDQSKPIVTVAHLIAANVGRHVTLHLAGEASRKVTGRLLAINDRQTVEPANPYAMTMRDEPNRRNYYGNQAVVLIKTDTGIVGVSIHQIVQCAVHGNDAVTERTIQRDAPVIDLVLNRPAAGKRVSISQLARGITWAPSYRIDLSKFGKASLAAKAVVINEAIDLDNVTLEFVTGYPNLAFADVNSPLALSQKLDQFIKSLVSRRSEYNRRSNVTGQRAMITNNVYVQAPGRVAEYVTQVDGTQAEDLFLYTQEGVSLKQGETAYLPLFTVDVPYEHIYVWNIGDFLDDNGRYRRNRSDSQQPLPEQVWHSFRFTNTSSAPLTTAPAQFVKDGHIVGQDVCYYTSPGGESTVRINRAMGIQAEQAEFETERESNAARFFGDTYDKITVRGELKLCNSMNKSVTVEVTKLLSGKIVKTIGDPKITVPAQGLRAVNPHHELVWTQSLDAEEETTLTYHYTVLVRR